jgi:hypothetical protein
MKMPTKCVAQQLSSWRASGGKPSQAYRNLKAELLEEILRGGTHEWVSFRPHAVWLNFP